MPGFFFDVFAPLLGAKTPAAASGGEGSPFSTLFMFLPIIALFYLMILRPQQQQQKKLRQMVEALKKNDRVLTSSGIYGTVVSIDPAGDKVVLRVDDDKGLKIAFSKASVARVLDVAADKPAETT